MKRTFIWFVISLVLISCNNQKLHYEKIDISGNWIEESCDFQLSKIITISEDEKMITTGVYNQTDTNIGELQPSQAVQEPEFYSISTIKYYDNYGEIYLLLPNDRKVDYKNFIIKFTYCNENRISMDFPNSMEKLELKRIDKVNWMR